MNTAIGVLSVALALLSYSLYIASALKGRSRPHAVTWGIWAVLNCFVFLEQAEAMAGPGAWVTGVAAVGNSVIFLLALKYGERTIRRLDWLCLILVGGLLLFWQQVSDPSITIILAMIIFLLGFIPTIRKVWSHPHDEYALTFLLNGVKFGIAYLALSTVTVVTALYPVTLAGINIIFASYAVYRQYTTPKTQKRRK